MNLETALPLDYAVQPNPPLRPTLFDADIRTKAVQSIAKDVADWLEEDVSDELVEMLAETMPFSLFIDGFKWAVKLHDKYAFDGDAQLVEILEGNNLSGIYREAVKAWVAANKIAPTFLVAAFGASDDLMEFRGAISDELGAWNGTTAYLDDKGLLQNKCGQDDCPYFEESRETARTIEAIWAPDNDNVSWAYQTDIPHATFLIKEDEDEFCRGIVFRLADATRKQAIEGAL